MHGFTDSIARLHDEILVSRQARHNLLANLHQQTAARKDALCQERTRFSCDLTALARSTKDHRLTFLSDLKRSVSKLQSRVRMDIAGVRKAFMGLHVVTLKAEGESHQRASQLAEALGQGDRQSPCVMPAESYGANGKEERSEPQEMRNQDGLESVQKTRPKVRRKRRLPSKVHNK